MKSFGSSLAQAGRRTLESTAAATAAAAEDAAKKQATTARDAASKQATAAQDAAKRQVDQTLTRNLSEEQQDSLQRAITQINDTTEAMKEAVRGAAEALARFVGGAEDAPVSASTPQSEVFMTEVEKPELSELQAAAPLVKKHTGITLVDDVRKRNEQLIQSYTKESRLYKDMNKALREDDPTTLREYAGYIRELRHAFRMDVADQVTKPFVGTVYRGIKVPNPEEVLKSYKIDQEYIWPSFTSTSTSNGFSGNVQFEIACPELPADYKGYMPANIKPFSVFPKEDEILFPPHCKLRVVGIEGNKIMMETTAFPSVWEMVSKGDNAGFERWAMMNPERLGMSGANKSLADAVATSSFSQKLPESLANKMGLKSDLCSKMQSKEGATSILKQGAKSLFRTTSGQSK